MVCNGIAMYGWQELHRDGYMESVWCTAETNSVHNNTPQCTYYTITTTCLGKSWELEFWVGGWLHGLMICRMDDDDGSE